MRSQTYKIGTDIIALLQPNPTRQFLMIRNMDPLNALYIQAGASPGGKGDFFPLNAGESFTLDPNTQFRQIVQTAWWMYASAPLQIVVFEG